MKQIVIDEINKHKLNKLYVSLQDEFFYDNKYVISLQDICLSVNDVNIVINSEDHHLCHAYCGFYTSPFDDALCIVMDGNGSYFNNEDDSRDTELESVYLFQNQELKDVIFTRDCSIITAENETVDLNNIDNFLSDDNQLSKELSCGLIYHNISKAMGFKWSDGGKVMGLSQYKNHKDKLPEGYNTNEWKYKVDIAHKLQKYTENRILKFVEKYVNETGVKNVVLSGGVFLNCVSNYNLIKKLGNDINIHIDPICPDNGISIGNALIAYTENTGKIPSRIKDSYLGTVEKEYSIEKYGFNYKNNVEYSDVCDILIDGNIIGLFQGQSEVGQRALGNRSFLFDPRVQDGRTIVNKIKKREDYRPFAATIMLEYVNDWFNLRSLKESPTMSFAVDAYERTINTVPAVIHVDGTCRIQTVTSNQNYHFYNLINNFYYKTGVPMLLNTSFNLAGCPLVETFEDAMATMNLSELRYIYLPEVKTLIFK